MLCGKYCSHGGACSLPPGHTGNHDASGYCQWPDEESVSRAEADATLASKGPEGAMTAGIWGLMVPDEE